MVPCSLVNNASSTDHVDTTTLVSESLFNLCHDRTIDQTSGHVDNKPESTSRLMGKAVADTNGEAADEVVEKWGCLVQPHAPCGVHIE